MRNPARQTRAQRPVFVCEFPILVPNTPITHLRLEAMAALRNALEAAGLWAVSNPSFDVLHASRCVRVTVEATKQPSQVDAVDPSATCCPMCRTELFFDSGKVIAA